MSRFENALQDSLLQGHPLECSVCLERMRDISYLVTAPDKHGHVCDHYFCTKCIEPIVELARSKGKEPQCPTCRRIVVAVNRSRIANELLHEIEKEREERKITIVQKEDLQKSFERLQEMEEQLRQDVEDLKERLEEQRDEIKEQYEDEVENLKEEHTNQIKKLKKENKRLKKQLELKPPEKPLPAPVPQNNHKEEIEKLQMMNNQYQNEREELNSAISRLNSENIRLLSEVEQFQLKIQEQEKRIEEFSSLPEKFQSVIDQQANEISSQKVQLEETKRNLEKNISLVKHQKEQMVQYKNQVEKQYFEIEKLKEQNRESSLLLKQVTELTISSEQVHQKYLQEHERYQSEKNKNEELSKETSTTKYQIKELNNKINESQQIIEQLTKQISEYKTQIAIITRDTMESKKQLDLKIEESDKWQRMYIQTREDIKLHHRMDSTGSTASTAQSPIKSPEKVDNSYLGGWLNPMKISTPISSYLKWNTTKSGRLIRSPNEYKFIERRGSSWNSGVWKAIYRSAISSPNERNVALKRINSNNGYESFRELMLLEKLDHKNIIDIEGLLRDTPFPNSDQLGDFMVMPFIAFDLEFLLTDTKNFKGQQVRGILYQLLCSLYYLHSGELCHRDIKPTSILIDENFNLKLGGFTNARSLYSTPYPKLPLTRYTSPECIYINDLKPTEMKASDIWSAGVVFAEMLRCGNPLFDSREKTQLLTQICSISECRPPSPQYAAKYPTLNCVPSDIKIVSISDKFQNLDVSEDALNLLQRMLHFDPAKRISAQEALQHPYFVKANYIDTHKSCGFSMELVDEEIQKFVNNHAGGL